MSSAASSDTGSSAPGSPPPASLTPSPPSTDSDSSAQSSIFDSASSASSTSSSPPPSRVPTPPPSSESTPSFPGSQWLSDPRIDQSVKDMVTSQPENSLLSGVLAPGVHRLKRDDGTTSTIHTLPQLSLDENGQLSLQEWKINTGPVSGVITFQSGARSDGGPGVHIRVTAGGDPASLLPASQGWANARPDIRQAMFSGSNLASTRAKPSWITNNPTPSATGPHEDYSDRDHSFSVRDSFEKNEVELPNSSAALSEKMKWQSVLSQWTRQEGIKNYVLDGGEINGHQAREELISTAIRQPEFQELWGSADLLASTAHWNARKRATKIWGNMERFSSADGFQTLTDAISAADRETTQLSIAANGDDALANILHPVVKLVSSENETGDPASGQQRYKLDRATQLSRLMWEGYATLDLLKHTDATSVEAQRAASRMSNRITFEGGDSGRLLEEEIDNWAERRRSLATDQPEVYVLDKSRQEQDDDDSSASTSLSSSAPSSWIQGRTLPHGSPSSWLPSIPSSQMRSILESLSTRGSPHVKRAFGLLA